MKKFFSSILFILTIILVINKNADAQNSPAISYPTPQVYTVGSTITPLSPTNTGGAAFPANYGTPVIFAAYPTPFGIAIDASNNVYTTNNTTGDVTKFSPTGTVLFTVNTGAPLASAVSVDGMGNIFVSQFTNNSVLEYSSTGVLLATVTGFSDPYEIAFDASNNAYVANYLSGNILEVKAGTKTAIPYLTGFNKPYGLVIDATGNMYVGEQGPGDIIKVIAGTLARTTIASGFNGPRHLNKDAFGNIYVADYGNNAVKRISPAGVVTSILSAGLNAPRQAAFDSSGNLYIADFGSNSLLKSTPATYAINLPLPAGLSFNTSTGQITGTPTTTGAPTKYTVTAYNTGGSSSAPLTITVGSPSQTLAQAPVDSTLAPSLVTTTTATLVGVANPGGATTLVSFTYGTDPNLVGATTILASTNNSLSAGSTGNSLLALTALTPLTTYYYQISATNPTGTTTGNIVSFKTLAAANANLSLLSTNNGAFTPGFSTATSNYNITVSDTISSINLIPTSADPNAAIAVNGTAVISGTPSAAIVLNVGNNTITTVVTAQDGVTTQSYTLNVTRLAPPANATLSNLTITGVNLNPVFNNNTNSYTAGAGNGITSVTVTPAASDSTATVTVNGVVVPAGSTSAGIPLNVGANTITVVVTPLNGTSNSYTTTITRAQSSIATLANMSISTGSLAPAFAAGTNNYTVNVGGSASSITVTPTVTDSTSTVTVNGVMATSGTASAPIALTLGANTITTLVTAQDGTTNTYTIAVTVTATKALSSIATLANLALTNGSLSPLFTSATTGYTANVGNNTSSIAVTPTVTDSTATISVNGITVPSGATSAPVQLNVGINTITAVVTAQDGTTSTYITTITRAQSSISTLAGLTLNNGSISPSFTPGTGSYTANVGNSVSSVTLTPATADSTETITINGVSVPFGSSSTAIPLNIGLNTISTLVTAQDGTTNTYTISVTRAASSVATLAGLTINNGSLSPSFATGITNYTTTVANGITSVTITPTTTDPTATIAINGTPVPSGSAAPALPLNVGNNTITTVVTAQDGTIYTYTTTITRAASSVATLASLTMSNCMPAPAFNAGTTAYTVNVGNAISSTVVTPVVTDSTATVTINGVTIPSGAASSAISLNVGLNTVTILVTAQDGTTNSYTTTITRAPSSIATLANLSAGGGSLSPSFATSTNAYNVTVGSAVTSVTLKPTPTDSTATVTVNGAPVPLGFASAAMSLNVGTNVITTIVTAQDGSTTDTYTTTVLRPSNDATLKQILVNSSIPHPSGNGLTNFTTSVINSTDSITVTPTANNAGATVTVNGILVTSGTPSAPIALNVGKNVITTVITAQDGTTIKTYSVTITRAPSSIATLANLTFSNGTLNPIFASGTSTYLTSVSNTISSISITPTATDSTATIKINGTSVINGTASAPITLKVGINIITTMVTAQDGITAKIYKTIVTRATSSIATLANLSISSGTISPVFADSTNSYTANVGSTTSLLTVIPTTSNAAATVKVNGITVQSGSLSRNITLNIGTTVITTVVTAGDGLTKHTYTLTVNRPSGDASLRSILANALPPHPVGNIYDFTTYVNNATTSIIVTPTANNAAATLTINGVPIASGTPSAPIALNVGKNIITTVITAQNGTTVKTYTLTVTRGASQIATLANLTLDNGSLSPQFTGGTINYFVNVNNAISSIVTVPTVTDTTATVKINGSIVTSGTASMPILLKLGRNIIIAVVTAQDGKTIKTYTVFVTRIAPASNALLSNLTLSTGPLDNVFAPTTFAYTAAVGRADSSVTVTPTTSDPYATIIVNGVPLASGTPSAPILLASGKNVIKVIVTAQNGSITHSYTITVNRQLPISNDASLAALTPAQGTPSSVTGAVVAVDNATYPLNGISGGTTTPGSNVFNITLNPGFNADTLNYSTTVDNAIAAVTITPVTKNAAATVTVNGVLLTSGATSAPMNLNIGSNVVKTVVTAEDGVTTRTYTLSLKRMDPTTADSTRFITFNDLDIKTYGDADFYAGASASTSEPIIYNGYDPNVISVTNGKIHIVGAGTTTLTATVAPDKNYINSPTVTQTLVVNKAKQTISFSQVPTLQRGTSYTLIEATSSSKLPIIYKSSDSTIMSVKGSSVNLLQLGSAFLTATQPGDANYLAASAINQLISIHDENDDKILVHQAVSPNGDGVNDFLLIEGIENYPGNKVAIINLNGETIYSTVGYNNSSKVFDGHSNINGRLEQPGTYFYMVEYTVNGQTRRKTGYFILKIN